MQNSISNLHAQLQHSTVVLDGFIPDVSTLKKESGALGKAVDSLAKDYIKQCRRFGTPASVANPVLERLENLSVSSRLVHDQADNLKVCLDAVVNRSYKPDLARMNQGKSPKTLKDCQQEAGTFETHIRLAESLVASVLPQREATVCHKALDANYGAVGDLDSAFEATQSLISPGVHTSLLGNLRMGTLKAAALHLRDQIETSSVRQRVPPYSQH